MTQRVLSVAPVAKHPIQRVRLDRAKVAEVQAITGTRTMAEAIELTLNLVSRGQEARLVIP